MTHSIKAHMSRNDYRTKATPQENFLNSMHECRIISLNMNRQRKSLIQCVRNQLSRYHIICLQEIGFSTEEEINGITFSLKKLSQYRSFWSPAEITQKGGRKGGIGIILHPDFYEQFDSVQVNWKTISKHYLNISCSSSRGNVHIHGVYGPGTAQERIDLFSALPYQFPIEDVQLVITQF